MRVLSQLFGGLLHTFGLAPLRNGVSFQIRSMLVATGQRWKRWRSPMTGNSVTAFRKSSVNVEQVQDLLVSHA
jgi:hypothetical protein